MRGLIFFILFFVFATAHAVPCPLGPKETSLTIQRIMRNFGRHFQPAENALLKASQNSAVSDEDIHGAIQGLMVVRACAEEALKLKKDGGYNEDLLPNRSFFMKDMERASYLETYSKLMGDFSEKISEFQKLFEDLLNVSVEKRDFSNLQEKVKTINKHINDSHKACSHTLGKI